MTVSKKEINDFFNVITNILEPNKKVYTLDGEVEKFSKRGYYKETKDKEGQFRTNVIYLNTNCNLRCGYCYEKDSREGLEDQANCTEEMIDSFIDEIHEREKGLNSCIVVMGGEPFLRFDLICYVVGKCAETPKKEGWAVNIITNGTTLNNDKNVEKLKQLLDFANNNKVHVRFEISYDCTGQFKRKWPDGSSSRDVVEKSMMKIKSYGIPYDISYTVHEGNYKNIVEDMVYILEKFSPGRLTVGVAYEEMDRILGPNKSFDIPKQIKPYAKHLFELYKTPICGIVCEYCGYCNRKDCAGNAYLSPTTGISYADKATNTGFGTF